MRDSYLGLNQVTSVELQKKFIDAKGKTKIEIEDLILIRRIGDFILSSESINVLIEGETFSWVNYEIIQEDLPMVFPSLVSLKKRIEKLKGLGLIVNHAYRVTKDKCSPNSFKNAGTYSVIILSNMAKKLFNIPENSLEKNMGFNHEGVKGFNHEGVKGFNHEGVKGFNHEGVKGWHHEGVKGWHHEGVTHNTMKVLTKNTMKEYHEREYPFMTDSQSDDQESNPRPVRKITQDEPRPVRKFAEESKLDNPVVKFMNKLMEQEIHFTNSEKIKIIGYCEELELDPMQSYIRSRYLQGVSGLKLTKRMFLRYDTWEKIKLGDYNDKEGIRNGKHQGTNGNGDEETREIARQRSTEKWGF